MVLLICHIAKSHSVTVLEKAKWRFCSFPEVLHSNDDKWNSLRRGTDSSLTSNFSSTWLLVLKLHFWTLLFVAARSCYNNLPPVPEKANQMTNIFEDKLPLYLQQIHPYCSDRCVSSYNAMSCQEADERIPFFFVFFLFFFCFFFC